MAISTARPSTTPDDRELAALAIAGNGDAFAQLYDRHERRVFGFCLRMLGTPDEAADATQETFMRLLKRLPALEGKDVNFIAYALASARNACYDTIEARRRVEPVGEPIEPGGSEPGEVELDPERAALLRATQASVRAANAGLPERQREVLALRELEQLSYEQIGEIVGVNSNAVAQLISRARIRLRDLVRGDALASIASSSPECERALPLLARIQDEQGSASEELNWVRAHVTNCETCQLSRAAMEEAGVSYRALGPIVPLIWLRHATIARAAELVGADWSHLASAAHGSAHGTTISSYNTTSSSYSSSSGARRRSGGHPQRWLLVAAAVLCLILTVVLASSVTPDSRVLPRQVTSVAGSTSTAHPNSHTIKLTHGAKASIHARPAPKGSALASLTSTSGARGDRPSVSTPTVHQTARRHASKRRSTHHATHHTSPPSPAPAGTPSSPPPPATTPPATTPSTTTPTSTTPAPSPPSGSAGGTETTTTPTGTPGGGSSGSTEGEHGCALAIACP